jgi:hypothetical protein
MFDINPRRGTNCKGKFFEIALFRLCLLNVTQILSFLRCGFKLVKILSKDTNDDSMVDGSLSSGSVIVYVWRQRDAELIAEYIQMSSNVVGGVVVYHGGMSSEDRFKAQSKVSSIRFSCIWLRLQQLIRSFSVY